MIVKNLKLAVNKIVFHPENRIWILLVLAVKLFYLIIFYGGLVQYQNDKFIGPLAVNMGDYEYFYEPVENFIKNGTYTLNGDNPFAGRMPGLAVPYYILRLVFSQIVATNIIVCSQIILGILSVYLLALASWNFLNSKKLFLLVLALSAIFPVNTLYDIFTWTESFAVSFLVFSFFFISKFHNKRQNHFLLIAGLFLAWSIFLRPYLGLLILFFPLIIFSWLFFKEKIRLIKIITALFIFVLPFTLFEASWIIRNYIQFNKIIPLETSLPESYGELSSYRTPALAIRNLIYTWGGITANFYPGSDGEWFFNSDDKFHTFPPYVYESGIDKDSLIVLRNYYHLSGPLNVTAEERAHYNIRSTEMAIRLAKKYKEEHLMRYYLINPLKRLKMYILPGTYLFPLPGYDKMTIFQKIFKIWSAFYYLILIVGGILACIYNIFYLKSIVSFLCFTIVFTLIWFGVYYSDWQANRYFTASFPFLILSFSNFLINISIKTKNATARRY
jgi:MFS family permease